MISVARRQPVRVSPRLKLGGFLRAWTPKASQPASRQCVLPEPPPITRIAVPALVPLAPVTLDPGTWVSGQASSYILGWFDLSFRESPSLGPPFLVGNERSSRPSGRAHEATQQADSTARVLAAALQPPLDMMLSTVGVLDWPYPLLEYQKLGVAALLERRRLLLADDMGLGKTVQVIAALRILLVRGEVTRALVVAPAGVIRQWLREFRKWAPEVTVIPVQGAPGERAALWQMPGPVHIVGYETLRGDVLDLAESVALKQKWNVVVLDEASRIKNCEAGISRACKRLPRERCWALTGTPLENRIEDLASILEFVTWDSTRSHPRRLSARDASALLPDYQLRRKKAEVLQDLPPKQICELYLDLSPAQRLTYDVAEREGVVKLSAAGESATVANVLELIGRLKQICNVDPVSGESSKLDDIKGRLEVLAGEGHKALVFSQYTDKSFGVQRVAEALREFNPLLYTGSMSPNDRTRVVDLFARDERHRVLVLSLRAGGVGLNLQSASYVFHLDRWWNPAIEDQAESRAHRMGQVQAVTVYRYICSNTIEERIGLKLIAKRALFHDVVDDVTLNLGDALTAEDLFGLFGLQSPRRKQSGDERISVPAFGAMSGVEFEDWVAERLETHGFRVSRTPLSHDGGVDLLACRCDHLGIESTLHVQCKNTNTPVGVGTVRELRGVVPDRSSGVTPIVACPSGFTSDAIAFAVQSGVLLWDMDALKNLAAGDISLCP